jgi:hypothetical protein
VWFRGHLRFTLPLTAIVVAVFGSLVLSGQLPPRGVVMGFARICADGNCASGVPIADSKLVFQRLDGPGVFVAVTDRGGYYAATLPAGRYRVQAEFVLQPDGQGHPGGVRRQDFSEGPREVLVAAGQRLQADYGVYVYPQ